MFVFIGAAIVIGSVIGGYLMERGNLMVLLQIGSMPHELTLKNIDMFAREVKPHFRDMWDDEWENRWWPEALQDRKPAALRSGAPHTAVERAAK